MGRRSVHGLDEEFLGALRRRLVRGNRVMYRSGHTAVSKSAVSENKSVSDEGR